MRLRGIIVPIITPLENEAKEDIESLQRLVTYLLQEEIDAIFVLGGAGEGSLLTDSSKSRVVKAVLDVLNKKVAVLCGVSDASIPRVKHNIDMFSNNGIDAYVVSLPYYAPLSVSEQVRFFTEIADYSDRPIILYNIPQRTKSDISMEALTTLVAHENIGGIKESTLDIVRYRALAKQKREYPNFMAYTGDPRIVDFALSLGFDGAVLALANIVPGELVKLYRSFLAGQTELVRRQQEVLLNVQNILTGSSSSSLPGTKFALKSLGIIKQDCLVAPYHCVESSDAERILEWVEQNRSALTFQ